tara:strand:- start:566 stop:850 length:285 start_codon:yes stop_codon:yes gene_type:complete
MARKRKRTQNSKILQHLLDGHSITPIEALEKFGCFRLGARIFELRKQGFIIDTKTVDNGKGNKFAKYILIHHEPMRAAVREIPLPTKYQEVIAE